MCPDYKFKLDDNIFEFLGFGNNKDKIVYIDFNFFDVGEPFFISYSCDKDFVCVGTAITKPNEVDNILNDNFYLEKKFTSAKILVASGDEHKASSHKNINTNDGVIYLTNTGKLPYIVSIKFNNGSLTKATR